MRTDNYDEWTIDRWRREPPIRGLDIVEDTTEQNPPLWKDLTLASVIAVLLWGLAAAVLG